MGTPLEFIQRVLPWPSAGEYGYCNLHYTRPGKDGFPGRPFTDPEQLLERAWWGNASPKWVQNQYICMSRQSSIGKVFNSTVYAERSKPNATHLKAIWLDIDGNKPDKGYGTKAEASAALKSFIKATGLPLPTAINDSGNGYHVYWISDRALSVEEWLPYAEGLWALAQKHGLKADAITTDRCRVLRIPGTFNWKGKPPLPVEQSFLAPSDIDFAKDLVWLTTLASPAKPSSAPSADLSAFKGKKPPEALAHLDPKEGFGLTVERTPLKPRPIFAACPMYKIALRNGGVGVQQPEWHLQVLGTTFMEDGRNIAHLISKGWKDDDGEYTPEETDAMFDRTQRSGVGWPSCKAFAEAGCKQCASCPLNGKITSPLNLGVTVAVTPPPSPPPANMHLPKGYTLIDGFIYEKIEVLDKETSMMVEAAPIQIFDCKLSAPYATADDHGRNMLYFRCTLDLDKSDVVGIPEKCLGTDLPCLTALAEVRVKVCYHAEKRARKFLKAWLTVLDAAKARSQAYPFGWIGDTSSDKGADGFVYAGKQYNRNGTVAEVGWASKELRASYTPAGTPDAWFELLKIVTDQKRPELEVLAALSFASPLLHLTGQSAGVLSAHGDSAGFKSTAVNLGAAVWGNCKASKMSADISYASLIGRLADLRNLPTFLDDAAKDVLAQVRDKVRTICEGKEPGRMDRNRNQRLQREWNALCAVTTNSALGDDILFKVKDTSASFVRVFEYTVPVTEKTMSETYVAEVQHKLEYNFGHMGMKYAALLGHHPERVKKLVSEAGHYWEDRVKTRAVERFWKSFCACIMVGATLANEIGATFHLDIIEPFLYAKFMDLRERMNTSTSLAGGGEDLGVDALTDFLKVMVEKSIWTRAIPSGRGRKAEIGTYKTPEHPTGIQVQWVPDDRVLYVSRDKFAEYLDMKEREIGIVFKSLKDHFKMVTKRGTLGAGTTWSQGPETLMVIKIPPGSVWEEMCFKHVPPKERPTDYMATIPAVALTAAAKDLELVRNMTTH